MEMPYWYDIEQSIEIYGDTEQIKTLSSTIYS